ncbi:MAG: sigma-70 family RNA polymerase sigma factor [Clostridia bacterium]|nr:sigma-70 family RNA polymerase sigma factor [Clostridia bacterium]
MRLYNIPNSLLYFSRYNWYLRALNTKQAERRKILADINSGLISRDTLDSDWQKSLEVEIGELKKHMHDIESTIESIPETPNLLPCKLFMRLYFVLGMSMTETAEKMNVSLSTLRRIRDRAARHFDDFPPHNYG